MMDVQQKPASTTLMIMPSHTWNKGSCLTLTRSTQALAPSMLLPAISANRTSLADISSSRIANTLAPSMPSARPAPPLHIYWHPTAQGLVPWDGGIRPIIGSQLGCLPGCSSHGAVCCPGCLLSASPSVLQHQGRSIGVNGSTGADAGLPAGLHALLVLLQLAGCLCLQLGMAAGSVGGCQAGAAHLQGHRHESERLSR